MWLAVIGDAARTGRSVIFTFAPEQTVAVGFPDRLRAVVESHGGTLLSVRLQVSPETQEQRLTDPSRLEFEKLTDVDLLRASRVSDTIVEQPAADLIIDTDTSDPESSADTIIAAFGLRSEAPVQRYPDPRQQREGQFRDQPQRR
jgi:hypothetical protein